MAVLAGAASISVLGGTNAGGGCTDALAAPGDRGVERRLDCRAVCLASARLRSVAARRSGRGLRLSFRRGSGRPVRVDVYRAARGRRVVRNRRVVTFRGRSRPFRWSGRARGRPVGPGFYVVRFRSGGETRRLAVLYSGGRFSRRPAFERGRSCDGLTVFRLAGPVFGGTRREPLGIVYRLAHPGQVRVMVKRGRRTIKRFPTRQRRPGRDYRLRVRTSVRGNVRVVLTARTGGRTIRSRLVAKGL